MKSFFFGDSLTHGMAHNRAERYATPWPRLIADKLREHDYEIVECAMCSRTTQFDDIYLDNADWLPNAKPEYFNGRKALVPQILSHSPHWLILLLGTNDLQSGIQDQYAQRRDTHYKVSHYQRAEEIAESCAELANEARSFFENMHVVIVTPPPVRLTEDNEEWGFTEDSVKISERFPEAFRRVCRRYGFLNAEIPVGEQEGQINMEDSEDGIHITEEHNQIIADAVWATMELDSDSPPRLRRRRRPIHVQNYYR